MTLTFHQENLFIQPTPKMNFTGAGGGVIAQPTAGQTAALNEDSQVELNEDGSAVIE